MIAILLRSLEGGGMQRNLLHLVDGLRRRGEQVVVLAADCAGPARSQLPAYVPVCALPTGAGRRGPLALAAAVPELPAADRLALALGPAPALVRALPALVRALRRFRPCALLGIGTQANLAALLAAPALDRPLRVVASEHNAMSTVARLSRRQFRRCYPRLAAALYPRAHAVVAVSEAVADDLAAVTGLPRGAIEVVSNPVDTAAIEAAAAQPMPPYAVSLRRRFLLAVGRLHWQKNFGALLEAFALVRQRLDLALVILGEGPERPRLEAAIGRLGLAGHVHLPGFDPNPFAWMARAAALVSTSRLEGFGHVLVEALACGCPVVAVDCPGAPRAILGEGRFGRLVPPDDPGALAEAIFETLDDPPDAAMLRRRAGAFAVGPAVDRYAELLLGETPRNAA